MRFSVVKLILLLTLNAVVMAIAGGLLILARIESYNAFQMYGKCVEQACRAEKAAMDAESRSISLAMRPGNH